MSRPRLLLVGYYPLTPADRAPAIRIAAMAESLARMTELTAIIGTRAERARRYGAVAARLADFDGVYVESATSMMTGSDWNFLRAARRAGLPLGIYVRDYYQRFPDLYPPKNPKERLMALGYHLTLREFRRLATVLFAQTEAFGAIVSPASVTTLPPAGRVLNPPAGLARIPHRVIYAGANGPQDGVDVAVAAMGEVVREMADAELILVLRPSEQPGRVPAYCRVVTASGPTLEPWLWSSAVGLVPRRHTRYFRLILPVKIFDYMAHGLALVVTQDSESARFVESRGIGLGAPDTARGFADAILRLFKNPALRQAMGDRALALVRQSHHWDARAHEVLRALGLESGPGGLRS